MERYSHLQSMPNSPLTPLTPLSENTAFNFNFGGDGSLDVYIDSIRQEHRIEQQQKKLLQQANQTYHKPGCPLQQPRHYSEEFLKIRNVFESNGHKEHHTDKMSLKEVPKKQCCQHKEQEPHMHVTASKTPTISITHTGATPTNNSSQKTPIYFTNNKKSSPNYVTTPTNVRTPLKQRNQNIILNNQQQKNQKMKQISQHHLPPQQHRSQVFRQASPVTAKPLCKHVEQILNQSGLSVYCGVFQREEIDLYAFQLLKLHDLHQIGIKNPKHCEKILSDVYYAGQYF